MSPVLTPTLTPIRAAVLTLAFLASAGAQAFNSGSTGADGDLAPAVDTVVNLPPSGILNYASINIPSGVKVSFKKNITNTPVILLVAGNAVIAGVIDVSGKPSTPSGSAGDGVLADDGNPGEGGAGGYTGGRGGRPGLVDFAERIGGKGMGPGGGGMTLRNTCNGEDWSTQNALGTGGGAGGGFGAVGGTSGYCVTVPGGLAYGAAELLPLIGGSGGGGGQAGRNWAGSGGGGGGGALMVAVSGTLTISNVTGKLLSNGGKSGDVAGAGCDTMNRASSGGGGSGGAIRLVATTIAGNGEISANAGNPGSYTCGAGGGSGGAGRIRLEAENTTRTAATTPPASIAQPGPVFIAGIPSLRITQVAGVDVPEFPTGVADVKLPLSTVNPVTIAFATTGVPVGNTVKLAVTPNNGPELNGVSTALTGSTASATATVSVALPGGASTLQATLSYTVVVALGQALSQFAQGEQVQSITLSAGLDGRGSRTTLVTVSGRELPASNAALAMLQAANVAAAAGV